MTRFYGLTREQQLREPFVSWLHYLNDIPFVAAWEQLRVLQTVHSTDAQKLARRLEQEIQTHMHKAKPEGKRQPRILEQIGALAMHPLLGKHVQIKKKDA